MVNLHSWENASPDCKKPKPLWTLFFIFTFWAAAAQAIGKSFFSDKSEKGKRKKLIMRVIHRHNMMKTHVKLELGYTAFCTAASVPDFSLLTYNLEIFNWHAHAIIFFIASLPRVFCIMRRWSRCWCNWLRVRRNCWCQPAAETMSTKVQISTWRSKARYHTCSCHNEPVGAERGVHSGADVKRLARVGQDWSSSDEIPVDVVATNQCRHTLKPWSQLSRTDSSVCQVRRSKHMNSL